MMFQFWWKKDSLVAKGFKLFLTLGVVLWSITAFASPTGKAKIAWPTAVQWVSFSEGQALAASSKKPMMVLVYADWCKQCDALAKALARPEFVEFASNFIMVLADHDNKTEGLMHYTPKLTYVPRIFFMEPSGEVWQALQSGSARYPYFYDSDDLSRLLKNMRRSVARHLGETK